jgi:GntP family gluconate:H+ symporter
MILAIIAAGGMFGEMLQTTGTAQQLGDSLRGLSLGIFFPFLMAAILKTAQGSSTIAVITTASLLHPSMAMLGVHNSFGLALTVLSMGAGSMMISHANDAYFWVVSRFSNLPVSTTLKVYSISSLLMAITAQLLIWSLYIFLN